MPSAMGGRLGARRVKVPQILQLEASECGAASLAMVLAYFGRWVGLDQARVDCGVSRDGSKASNVLAAARTYGMTAKGYRKEVAGLADLAMPLIIHWNFNHFLVLEGFRGEEVWLADPASGRRVVSMAEFSESYTGIALSVVPGESFAPGGRRPRPVRAIARRLKGSEGAVALIVLLAFTLVLPAIAIPAFAKAFIDGVLVDDQSGWLKPLIIGLVATALLRGGLLLLQQSLLIRLQNRIAVAGASRFVWHLLRLPMVFFGQRHPGDIASRVRATNRLADTLSGDLSQAALDGATTLVLGVVMLAYDPLLGAIAVLALVPNVMLLRLISERQRRLSERQGSEEAKLHAASVGVVESIETLKASGLEARAFERWAGYQAKLLDVRRELGTSEVWISVAPTVLRALGIVVVLAVGAARVLRGELSVGSLVAFLSIAESFAEPIGRIVGMAGRLRSAETDVLRVDDTLNYPADPKIAHAQDREEPPIRGELELRDVTFGYSRFEPPLIENFSLHVSPGRRVALVGSSGSGKSTITRLLNGFAQPWSGEILLDGRPLNSLSPRERARVLAAVDQEVFFFEGTVRENLTLWDDTIEDRRLIAALGDAAILDEILSRPGRLDALVAEAGINFSGGQRQRLEIARALSGDPAVLILDEATAALDAGTEHAIDRALRSRGATCVIVAHRLSTVRDADEIVVMRRGRIMERGTHDALMALNGDYAALIGSH
jgi:NHLM bacteriocin system ABC transporter peptidase/ATP-binding protein